MISYDLGNGFKLQVLRTIEKEISESLLEDIAEKVSELIYNMIGGRTPRENLDEINNN